MNVLKVILVALGACVLALAAAALFVVASWSQFEPHQVAGSTMEDTGAPLTELTEAWILDYAEGLQGWQVPFSWQIRDMVVDQVEDLGENCVQIDYHFRTLLRHPRFADDWIAFTSATGSNRYTGQMVVCWLQDGRNWVIKTTMAPVT